LVLLALPMVFFAELARLGRWDICPCVVLGSTAPRGALAPTFLLLLPEAALGRLFCSADWRKMRWPMRRNARSWRQWWP
jgi:hypothetical protein